MKAQELRVGNIVKSQYDKKPIVIRGFDINDLCEGMDSECFQPMPLTEEWLLKFGTKKTIENNFEWKDNSLAVYFKPNKKIYFMIATYMDRAPGKEIKYVHQLQNLYFALTGEELILK